MKQGIKGLIKKVPFVKSLSEQVGTLSEQSRKLSEQVDTLTEEAKNLNQQVDTLTKEAKNLNQQVRKQGAFPAASPRLV